MWVRLVMPVTKLLQISSLVHSLQRKFSKYKKNFFFFLDTTEPFSCHKVKSNNFHVKRLYLFKWKAVSINEDDRETKWEKVSSVTKRKSKPVDLDHIEKKI